MMMKSVTIAVAAAAAMLVPADWHPRKVWAGAPWQAHAPRRSKDTAPTNGMVRARRALASSRTGAGFPMIAGRCWAVPGAVSAGGSHADY